MPPKCPPLAVELIFQILENVADAESSRVHGTSRFPNLLACAAVSKTWAPLSQSLIFRNVILETLVQAWAFMLAVQGNDEKAAFLRRSVTSMEIIVNDEEAGQVITQMTLAHILRLCPKLKSVKIFYYCLRPLDAATINVLRQVAPPSALSLHCAQDPSPLWDLLELWPNTQHLEVVTWETITGAITKPPSRTWAPLELRWVDDSDSGEATMPCLTPSPGSLRILQLMKPPSDAFFRGLMETHGPFLRSLRLSTIGDQVADSIAYCQNLEEFKYGDVPSLPLLQALPIGLEHLQFQGNRRKDSAGIGHVIEFIEEKGAALKVVTYNLCGSPKEEDFIRLAVICKEKQINLRCYADSAPMEEKEPLTCPAHFPRPTPHHYSRRPLPLAAIRRASQIRLPPQLSRAPSSLRIVPTLPPTRSDDDHLVSTFSPTKDRQMGYLAKGLSTLMFTWR